MENTLKEQLIKICDNVAKATKEDATNFDGQLFTGKVVATYLGYQGASIAALATILKEVIENIK